MLMHFLKDDRKAVCNQFAWNLVHPSYVIPRVNVLPKLLRVGGLVQGSPLD